MYNSSKRKLSWSEHGLTTPTYSLDKKIDWGCVSMPAVLEWDVRKWHMGQMFGSPHTFEHVVYLRCLCIAAHFFSLLSHSVFHYRAAGHSSSLMFLKSPQAPHNFYLMRNSQRRSWVGWDFSGLLRHLPWPPSSRWKPKRLRPIHSSLH